MPSKNAPTEIVEKLTGFAGWRVHHALPAIFPYRGFASPAAHMTAAPTIRCGKDAPEHARCWQQQQAPTHKLILLKEYLDVSDVRPVLASRGHEEAGRSLPQELDI
jgi:hypothetical protein